MAPTWADILGAPFTARASRIREREAGSDAARDALEEVMQRLDDAGKAWVSKALDYALSLQYRHAGLSTSAYLAHPLRVARLVLLAEDPPDVEAVMMALVHNVLETTTEGAAQLAAALGPGVARGVAALTVDREQQYEPAYTRIYYDQIRAAGRSVQLVKVFDKLDNLFLLDMNPDRELKAQYLEEAEREILPMARGAVPSLSSYLSAVIDDQRQRMTSHAGAPK